MAVFWCLGRGFLICIVFCLFFGSYSPVLLYSFFSWGGLRGNITFSWTGPGSNVSVEISTELTSTLPPSETELEFDWSIYEFPVRQDMPKKCRTNKLGKQEIDLSAIFGKLVLPMEGVKAFSTSRIGIVGKNSIWGKTIRIFNKNNSTCGLIQGVGDEKTYEARFRSPIGGSVWMRTWTWEAHLEGAEVNSDAEKSGTEMFVLTDVFNTFDDELTASQHDWNLYITDIIDDGSYRSSCNFLTTVYDMMGKSECDSSGCPEGDFTRKFGQLTVGDIRKRTTKRIYRSSISPLPDLSGPRKLYIGIEDRILTNNVYACAKLRPIKPKSVLAFFSHDGIEGKINIKQNSIFDPTELSLDLHGLAGKAGGFHVHELPVTFPLKPGHSVCGNAAGHYNPYKVDPELSPVPGTGSHDEYELGDLSGKHGLLLGLDQISATVIDHNLPMFGPRSIVGRSIVIHYKNGNRWVCANLRQEVPLLRAVVLFRYPFVGEIVFEQEAEDPKADTTILVGPLLYSDGSHNDTSEHEWIIHYELPDKDFYDWQNRCRSAGDRTFNPYMISQAHKVYKSCGIDNQERCIVGDLYKRHDPLKISGSTGSAQATRKVYTDSNLSLSGPKSILKHSLVVYDKTAPKHRGNRTACAGIFRRFRYKAVVNRWSTTANSDDLVEGKLEFIQESPYDISNTEIDLRGLEGVASGYHVHMVPVLQDVSFPCEASALYGHFNPLNVTKPFPTPTEGTFDQYELGDLSGKYGTLDGKKWVREFYNDSNLPLFGANSIIGRSVVVHKRIKSERWFCGSIGFGYSPSEARQVAAIASFHHPKGYAWGYVRLRQLIYLDGMQSETYIEINLRHPGANNKNITRGHNWSVYVNPVGVDAAVKFFNSRCVASGYRWNPFLIQLAHPNDRDYYDKQCTPEYPYRCDAGDISGRLGQIDLGDKRYVFMDKNLPLAGEHSAMGKAIVIHTEKGGIERFACANILPDEDIVKWANVRKSAKFSPAEFMIDMREILGAPEWFLALDYQSVTYSADHRCVTFRIFFMGPNARALEQDFSRLLAGGLLDKPTISVPGLYPPSDRKKKVLYRTCGGFDDEDLQNLDKGNSWWNFDISRSGAAPSSAMQRGIIFNLACLSLYLYSFR